MKIGDLVKCRSRNGGENYDNWLGIIIGELPGTAEYKKVQWVNSEDHNALEIVSHEAKDLVMLNENR